MEMISLRKWIKENRFDPKFHKEHANSTPAERTGFCRFIYNAFLWASTPEGHLFWRFMAKRAEGKNDLKVSFDSWK